MSKNPALQHQATENVYFYDAHPALADSRSELLDGLAQPQKSVDPKWFYDAAGSDLFEQITALPEYYPTRTEISIEKNAFKGTALRLDFDIYMKRYNSLPKRNGRQIVPEMNLIPGDRRVLMIDISKYYDLSKEGRYIISAVLAGKKGTLMSNKKVVDVVRGIELASVTKEVPGYEEEYRKISVRYWNRHRKEILFLTVDDEVNHTNYGVFQLGPLIRINKPVIKYDRSGRFSVTHQCRGDCFVVTSFQLAHTSVTSLNQRYLTHEGTPYTMANSSKGRLIEELKVKSKRSDKK